MMLQGRRALVTGSLGGIGYACAAALAREGCAVTLNGFAPSHEAEAQRRALADAHGVEARYDGADLRDPAQVAALVDGAGPLDILVNNATVRTHALVDDFPPENWDEALAVGLSAPFHAIRRALPGMRARRWGRIVNIASVFGLFAVRGRVDYVTTKHGLIGLTKAVALDAIEHGVTCNAVCPGLTLTPNTQRSIDTRIAATGGAPETVTQAFVAERQPSGRMIQPEQVAALVLFLCSAAAAEMTGAALPMDGAWSAS